MQNAVRPDAVIPAPKDQSVPSASNLFKSAFLVLALLGSFYVTQQIAGPMEDTPLRWSIIIAAAIWNSMLLIGMGVLSHEAVHGVLFRSRFWNEFIGGLLAALVLIPLEANRQFHIEHHRYSHQPGLDPENLIHQPSLLYAVTLGPFVALFAQYQVMAKIAASGGIDHVLRDICYLGIAFSFYLLLLPALGISLVITWGATTLLALPIVFSVRALADHYGIPAVVRPDENSEEMKDGEWMRKQVSGWVVLTPRWLQWLWSHVNYHEVHHKYPYLSHAHLAQAFAASRGEYPYLVVDGYWKAVSNAMKLKYYGSPEGVQQFMAAKN